MFFLGLIKLRKPFFSLHNMLGNFHTRITTRMVFPAKFSDRHSSRFRAIFTLYERCRKFPNSLIVSRMLSFFNFSMFGSIIRCVLRCPRINDVTNHCKKDYLKICRSEKVKLKQGRVSNGVLPCDF
jgi:hypothetical protein